MVSKINILEDKYVSLTDEELKEQTTILKNRLQQGEDLDDILFDAFAVVREASKRVLGMRHYDVQLIGGIALHEGKISEMKTGEGKTLVSSLPAYLNALAGKGVHIVTVNEYLAARDAEEMGKLHTFLGLTVGLNLTNSSSEEKQEAYACDITYSTNNEIGFDYLRDNMVMDKEQKVQRELSFAIIDEVDSVLIDEARTPLIISGSSGKSAKDYMLANAFVRTLELNRDYTYDIKEKNVQLTEEGISKAEKAFHVENLFDVSSSKIFHHINQALKANVVFKKDVDYVVQDDEILIVDSFTGRLMPGRRYSDGIHQAIEAKEGVAIQKESMTLATITFQNLFRMYKKLSGMTGTAKTEEEEFRDIYGMEVVVIPTNKPVARMDSPDLIYKNSEAKFRAVVREIKERHQMGQPVLVGTVDIETSEYLSELLKKSGVKHTVLNAKQHEKEAEIISMAGQKGAVTISTNMAGRGTDIKLGEGVSDLGGLCVIGTERHESRRIDNQLRGRSGRQGDPGYSRFYISLEDELMRRFGSDNISSVMERLGLPEDEAIESRIVSKAVESAQKRVEGNNFDARRHLLKYDNVMNEQREIIYKQRNTILNKDSVQNVIEEMIETVLTRLVYIYASEEAVPEEYDLQSLLERLNAIFFETSVIRYENIKEKEAVELKEFIHSSILELYKQRRNGFPDMFNEFEKMVILQSVDRRWVEHIDALVELRQGIHLRAYGQIDPLREYQLEAFNMFEELISHIEEQVCTLIFKSTIEIEEEPEGILDEAVSYNHSDETAVKKPVQTNKIGRNDLCHCGSGKKYKHCHGK